MSYTFGDNPEASARLKRLAEVYEPETRELLERAWSFNGKRAFELCLDLGCGPGWSTALIAATLNPRRTIGLDASESYVAEARSNHPRLEFMRHDVLKGPFPIENADFVFCRFLLTHLMSPRAALECWAQAARRDGILAIHETESLFTEDATLARYYEMVAQMQSHYGQDLNVGGSLDAAIAGTGWELLHSEAVVLEKAARDMAQLHLANLRTWRTNEFAAAAFDKRAIEELGNSLASIASGIQEAGVVYNSARRMIARRK